MYSKEEKTALGRERSLPLSLRVSGDAFVGRFSRDESQAVREGALPYMDETRYGGREEPREAGAHDIVVSEADRSFDLMGVEIIGDAFVGDAFVGDAFVGDAFVGAAEIVGDGDRVIGNAGRIEIGDAFVGHNRWRKRRNRNRPRTPEEAAMHKARRARRRQMTEAVQAPTAPSTNAASAPASYYASAVSGDGEDEADVKLSPQVMTYLQQIVRGLNSRDSGQLGTARADYQSHLERARGGDKRSKQYLKVIDKMRSGSSTTGDAFVGQDQLAAAKAVLQAANSGDKQAQLLITTAAKHAAGGSAEAAQAMKLLNTVATMKGDAFVGHHRRGHRGKKDIVTASLGAICGGDTYRMGLASGNEEAVFDMEDGYKDSLDPYFKDPDNVYNDVVAPQVDVELDDAAAADVPEFVASIEGAVGAICGADCYRRGL